MTLQSHKYNTWLCVKWIRLCLLNNYSQFFIHRNYLIFKWHKNEKKFSNLVSFQARRKFVLHFYLKALD